jgi:hypothetical protein
LQAATSGGDTFGLEERRFELSGAFYFVAVCETCKGILLYWAGPDNHIKPEVFYEAELVWPRPVTHHVSVPKEIINRYEVASRVKDHPDSFAVEIRKAVECLCIQKGVDPSKGRLHQAIERLRKLKLISEEIAEIALALKEFGNEGAHEQGEINSQQVPVIEELFLTIIDQVYVSPYESETMGRRVSEAQKRAKDVKGMSAEKRKSRSVNNG